MNHAKNKIFTTALCSLISAGLALTAHANLVQNGGFETTTAGGNPDTTPGSGQLGYNINATGWTSNPNATTAPYSYNYLFASGSADTTGADGEYGALTLYGPNNGTANGLPASSPAGGNFVGLDSDVAYNGALTQMINGLTPGHTYALSFYWAGAQQTTFGGTTTDLLEVSLGAQTQTTSTIAVASHGFDPWTEVTFNYTATASSELLSFLAEGTPLVPNEPPFVLLDGVDLESSIPDSSSTSLLFCLSLAVLAFVAKRKSAVPSLVGK